MDRSVTHDARLGRELTPDALAEALRVELRQALWEAGISLHRNTIKALARRVAHQIVTYPSSHTS